jgi:hypothetical protein
LPPTGHVELVSSAVPAALLEVLVAADGSTLSSAFWSATRTTRDGKAVLRITDLAAGEWRYVVAETPAELSIILAGGARSLAPRATFSIQPAATTVVAVHESSDDPVVRQQRATTAPQ